MLQFLQAEGKPLHQQEDYNSLYCATRFIAVDWNQTLHIRGIPVHIISKLNLTVNSGIFALEMDLVPWLLCPGRLDLADAEP